MRKGEKAPMPANLCAAAQRLWKDAFRDWELSDTAGLVILANACRSLTRLRALEHVLEREGLLIGGRFGKEHKIRNPAHAAMLTEARNFREHMRALQLDVESLYDKED